LITLSAIYFLLISVYFFLTAMILKKYVRLFLLPSLLVVLTTFIHSCFLFPVGPEEIATFSPKLEWIRSTKGAVMDRFIDDGVVVAGDTTVDGAVIPVIVAYNPDGSVLYHGTKPSEKTAPIKDIIVDVDTRSSASYATIINHFGDSSVPFLPYRTRTHLSSQSNFLYTNLYIRFNTFTGAPESRHLPYTGDVDVVGPSVTRGPKRGQFRYSLWVVGSFTDTFQPYDNDGGRNFSCPTLGKADCFVMRTNRRLGIQWGGPENDLAYDVASDNIGNATIFLRAGSDFGITSATQSIVRMKTGYNIARLDTNGLLTETFPVALEATGEITDAQIALSKGGAVYILAKDEVKKQYFLAKVSRSGTTWLRYFPPDVTNRDKSIPVNRDARMGLTVDSKDCAYITGNFSGTVDLHGASLSSESVQVFTAKYSPSGSCLGALAMGNGLGVTVRLSPQEDALYVCGWAEGRIMGTFIPSQDMPRLGILRPGAFLVKLKLTK
jgi:hypothetical protein